MNRTAQGVLFLAVAAAALAAGFLLHSRGDERPAPAPAGAAKLMAAALPDLSGQTQRLDQWRGKVLLVNFWATWCAPCKKEIPELVRAQERLGPNGLQIVGIAIDEPDKVRPYAAEMKINYPVLVSDLEAMDLARQAGNELGGLPFTVVFDRSGQPVRSELGRLDEAKLNKLVEAIL